MKQEMQGFLFGFIAMLNEQNNSLEYKDKNWIMEKGEGVPKNWFIFSLTQFGVALNI